MIQLRKYPFPYVAALAICSDPDSTRNMEDYVRFHDWLEEMPTASGRGLHISDGLFLKSRSLVSFLDESLQLDARVADMVRAGRVDTIHSFAELDEEESGAPALTQALDALSAQGIKVDIWSNHSRSRFSMFTGEGDAPGSRYYHASQLAKFGIRFLWFAGFTPIWGQDIRVQPAQLLEILQHPCGMEPLVVRSCLGIIGKLVLARVSSRYSTYRGNRLLCPVIARDGTRFWSFMRHGARLGRNDRFIHLAEILSASRLDQLIRRQAATIVYTHFGKSDGDCAITNREAVMETFSALAGQTNSIWVCPTSCLLRYVVSRDHLDWTVDQRSAVLTIRGISDPVSGYRQATARDLEGITLSSHRGDIRIVVPAGMRVERSNQGNQFHYLLKEDEVAVPVDSRGIQIQSLEQSS